MSLIEIERREAVAIVRFNNPPKGYMNAAMVGELDASVDRLLADDTVRVLVFTGALKGVFVEHYDVSELLALSEKLRAKGAIFSPDRPSTLCAHTRAFLFPELVGAGARARGLLSSSNSHFQCTAVPGPALFLGHPFS